MATKKLHGEEIEDPCGDIGPAQRWAYVWFATVIVIGLAMTFVFSRIDSWMYANDAELFDYGAWRENRWASTALGSDNFDSRGDGNYGSAVGQLSSNR